MSVSGVGVKVRFLYWGRGTPFEIQGDVFGAADILHMMQAVKATGTRSAVLQRKRIKPIFK